MPVMTSAADLRAAARRGEWRGTTAGHCSAYQQVNPVILPRDVAAEFAAFCTRNPKPCPIIEITVAGDPEPLRSAPGADLRTDVPGYRIYRRGELAEKRADIRDVWRDDLVAFLLGCSFTFEHALTSLSARSSEISKGFSSRMCLPAAANFSTSSRCVFGGVRIRTASTVLSLTMLSMLSHRENGNFCPNCVRRAAVGLYAYATSTLRSSRLFA